MVTMCSGCCRYREYRARDLYVLILQMLDKTVRCAGPLRGEMEVPGMKGRNYAPGTRGHGK